MKKVLFVATLVKNHLMEFHQPYLKLFHDLGWETSVVSRNDYENPDQCVIPNCDHFYDAPFERSPLKKGNLTACRITRRVIRDGNFDIIHCHTPMGAVAARLGALGARKRGTKVIYTAHGFHFYKGAPLRNWLLYFPVEWLLAPVTDVLITINREDYARAKKCLRAKSIVYIPGVGIDTEKFRGNEARGAALRRELGIPENATVLLSVGDLNTNKNHALVLEALARLRDPNLYYVVCGRGELQQAHEDYVRTHGLEGRVFFMGYRNDVKDFYAMADAFVFPSFREGLSVSVMEAMASGLPVLASRIRGNTDILEEGVNGFLFDPADTADLVRALERLPRGERRLEMGRANRERAEHYSIHTIVDAYREIYRSQGLGD